MHRHYNLSQGIPWNGTLQEVGSDAGEEARYREYLTLGVRDALANFIIVQRVGPTFYS